MENNCLNCGQEITANYCANCGQKKYRRIDRKYIIEEAQYSLLHTNKGFLYSIKNILKNPGKTAREFIDGNRVNHYKPILLAFVLSGISAFIAIKLIGLYEKMGEMNIEGAKVSSPMMQEIMAFMTSYNSFLALLMIPFFALFTNLAFYKWGHNYYEHIVMNAFIQSFYTLIYIAVLYPLMYVFKNDSHTLSLLSMSIFFIMPFILVWFFKGFYKERKLSAIILRVLLMFMTVGILYIIVMIVGILIMVVTGELETIKQQMQQQN